MSLSIILIRPQMGENIGAAARVMKNFGLSDLRLVSPRDGWPSEAASAMAAGGADVIQSARLYDSIREALADLQCVYATTARRRDMEKPVLLCREAAESLAKKQVDGNRVGVLFGPERSGLENEDVALCDAILTVDVNEQYPSLNLAQAVALVCYEWRCNVPPAGLQQPSEAATKDVLYSLFDHLERELDARGFWKVEAKKPVMWRNIRNLFQRAELTDQEVRTLHGIIACLSERDPS